MKLQDFIEKHNTMLQELRESRDFLVQNCVLVRF